MYYYQYILSNSHLSLVLTSVPFSDKSFGVFRSSLPEPVKASVGSFSIPSVFARTMASVKSQVPILPVSGGFGQQVGLNFNYQQSNRVLPISVVGRKEALLGLSPVVPVSGQRLINVIPPTPAVQIPKPALSLPVRGLMSSVSKVAGPVLTPATSGMFQSEFNYSTIHPLTGTTVRGLRGNPDKVDWSKHMSRSGYLLQTEADIQALIFNAVVSNSQATYASAQKSYLRWCMIVGTNPTLTLIPPEWEETAPHAHSFKTTVLAGYVSYLVNDNEGKSVKESSAGNYLSAARKLLEDCGEDVSFMKDNPVLKAVKKGLKNEWAAVPGHSKGETATYCVTIDMLETAATAFLQLDSNLLHLGQLTAAIMSYDRTCRTSEIIWCPKTKHHVKTEAVQFIVMPVGEVFSGTLPTVLTWVDSSDIHAYPLSRVAGHDLFLVDSKNDQFGKGHSNPHTRRLNYKDLHMVYDLTEVLYRWAVRARPLKGQPFLSSSIGEKIVIVRSHLVEFLHQIADMYGLDRSRVNTHSLRYAGASAMKAAGFSDSVIMYMGRWESLCFLRYIRIAIATHLAVSDALATRNTLTFKDVSLLRA
jgi:hypothetical protein